MRPTHLRIAGLFFCLLAGCQTTPSNSSKSNGPLVNSVYIWQRDWRPAVITATGEHGRHFHEIVILGAEIEWPQTVSIHPNWAVLKATGRPIVLGVRVGQREGISADSAPYGQIARTCLALLQRATQAGVKIHGLQIDFDAASRQLPDYARWLARLRTDLPVPVSFTALPTWLDAPGFKQLAASAERYVLQVHWLQGGRICDPYLARTAVKKAGRFGRPFQVALPTYGHRLKSGGAIRTPPAEMAGLVRGWTRHRPGSMTGIIWYRLPVGEEQLNWSWPTLAAVIRGEIPRPKLVISSRREGALHTLVARNTGNAAAALPKISVRCPAIVSGDGQGGYDFRRGATGALFSPDSSARWKVLSPGAEHTLGWLRLERPGPIALTIGP